MVDAGTVGGGWPGRSGRRVVVGPVVDWPALGVGAWPGLGQRLAKAVFSGSRDLSAR